MNKFKLNDFVLDRRFGWGNIILINKPIINEKVNYIIKVKFTKITIMYTEEGKFISGDNYPTLFTEREADIYFNLFIPVITPNLEIDTKLIVWNKSDNKFNAYFSHFDKKGNLYCFMNGRTSWSNTTAQKQKWDHYILNENVI